MECAVAAPHMQVLLKIYLKPFKIRRELPGKLAPTLDPVQFAEDPMSRWFAANQNDLLSMETSLISTEILR